MSIQWSGEAADAMSRKLRGAGDGLEHCAQQTAAALDGLEQLNDEGGNKALLTAIRRLEACRDSLKGLADSLTEYRAALHKADDLFTGAEDSACRAAMECVQPQLFSKRAGGESTRQLHWSPQTYAVMPALRTIGLAPLPGWLETMAEEAESFIV